MSREPLWPFGHGLSYTTFALANLRVSPSTIAAGGRAEVTIDVVNTGRVTGDEVVQLYVRDLVSSVTRPTKELCGFERVTLNPGQKKTVTFSLGSEALSLIDRQMKRVVEPGRFEIMVGTSSTQITTPDVGRLHAERAIHGRRPFNHKAARKAHQRPQRNLCDLGDLRGLCA